VENLYLTSYGGIDEEQINCLESWLAVCLSFTDLTVDNGIPKAELQEGQEPLHAHADQVRHNLYKRLPGQLQNSKKRSYLGIHF
jgi:hypothetical protein